MFVWLHDGVGDLLLGVALLAYATFGQGTSAETRLIVSELFCRVAWNPAVPKTLESELVAHNRDLVEIRRLLKKMHRE